MKNNHLNLAYLDFDDIRNPLLNAGQARATYEVASRLAMRGHKIIVISSKYPGYKDRVEKGMKYIHIGLGSRFVRLNNIFYNFTLPFVVSKLRADIIIECFTPPISVLLSPLFTKTPVVILPSMFNANEFAKKYHLPFHFIEKLGIKFYKYMLPYSKVDHDKALSMNSKLICRITPQGVGKEYFSIKMKAPRHILFLGRYDIAQKGIDLLITAYAKIKDRISYPLVIAGHGPDEKSIKKLVKNLGIEDKVKIVGPAYGSKKFGLMSEALFVAFPSRHEELSLWALEALACGLPLVTFNLPEFSWASRKIALKAKPFDADEYSQLLIKATNQKLVRQMGNEAKKFARKYDWDKVTNQIESFLVYILKKERKDYGKN